MDDKVYEAVGVSSGTNVRIGYPLAHETSQRIREVIEAAREWRKRLPTNPSLGFWSACNNLAAAVDRLDSTENKTT